MVVKFEVIYFADGKSIWDKGQDGFKAIKPRITHNGYETASVMCDSFEQAYEWLMEGQQNEIKL